MTTRIDRNEESGEGRIVLIKSFTSPDLTYRVNVTTLECSCKRFRFTGTCEKHILQATALAGVEVRFGKEAAQEDITRLVRKMYSDLSPQESYRLLVSVLTSPYASRTMRRVMQRRHLALVSGVAA